MGLVFCILPVPFFRTNDSGFVGLGVDSASIMSIISSIIDPFYENKNKNNRRFEKNIPGRARWNHPHSPLTHSGVFPRRC